MRNFYKVKDAPEDLKLPERGTVRSAGYDFFSPEDYVIKPNARVIIPTYIKARMETDEVLMIYPRSSYGFKYGMQLANTVGIIDSDYYDNPDNEGNIYIKVYNTGDSDINIKKNDAFAQGIFMKYLKTSDDNIKTERVGGIGSTDKK